MKYQKNHPIKYIEDNLILHKNGEWWAYYEVLQYHYAFLGMDKSIQKSDDFRSMIGQIREGNIHLLQVATETSIEAEQEKSKEGITGSLEELAIKKIDEQTDKLFEHIGEHQVDYRSFIGFKLTSSEREITIKNMMKSFAKGFDDFCRGVNHTLMGDFVSVNNDEIRRFSKVEKLLRNKLTRRFGVRRLTPDDIGYIIEHIYGASGTAYEDYMYHLPMEKLKETALVKYQDILKLTRSLVREKPHGLEIYREEGTVYAAYFAVSDIIGELEFPGSEILFYQQQEFDFPVDTSINIEIVPNRKALTTVRNKKKEIKDLEDHAWKAGSESSHNVMDAVESVDELEAALGRTKESMYKLTYTMRVTAPDRDELKRRCNEVRDYYDDTNTHGVAAFADIDSSYAQWRIVCEVANAHDWHTHAGVHTWS